MSVLAVAAPLIYLAFGLMLGRAPWEIRPQASALLTRIVIPLVIVFNIATHQPGVFAIMLGTALIMALMLAYSRLLSRYPVHNLCFCYLNIGWLGLPIASSLFGDGAAMVIIAAYVGSSLFGNTVSAGLLAQGIPLSQRLLHTLRAPPVWALATGLALMPWHDTLLAWGSPLYSVLKFAMSFLGMTILGIWLSGTRLRAQGLRQGLLIFAQRGLAMAVLISLFLLLGRQAGIRLIADNAPTLYLMCLLPPAANIVVLETHYLKTGRSADLIAWGTCISVVALAGYGVATLMLR